MQRRMSSITFIDDNFKAIDPKQDDPMVITVTIEDFTVIKTLVDQGSSCRYPILEDIQKTANTGDQDPTI